MPILYPYCFQCGTVCEIWKGTDGLRRYVCPHMHLMTYGVQNEVVLGAMEEHVNPYVNHCWNCQSGIDSRVPEVCPRDEEPGKSHLFCCPNCGESMRNFPGRKTL